MSYIEKDTEILQEKKYASRKHTSTRERIVDRRDSSNIYKLQGI